MVLESDVTNERMSLIRGNTIRRTNSVSYSPPPPDYVLTRWTRTCRDHNYHNLWGKIFIFIDCNTILKVWTVIYGTESCSKLRRNEWMKIEIPKMWTRDWYIIHQIIDISGTQISGMHRGTIQAPVQRGSWFFCGGARRQSSNLKIKYKTTWQWFVSMVFVHDRH
jgi:hypothetical protein